MAQTARDGSPQEHFAQSAVGWQEGECPALQGKHAPEGALVKRKQPPRAEALRQDDQRRISKADGQVATPVGDSECSRQFRTGQAFHLKSALGEIFTECPRPTAGSRRC